MRIPLLLLCSLTALLRCQATPPAPAEADRALLLTRLQRFDTRSTDWTLLIDVGDKVQELGAAAGPRTGRQAVAAVAGQQTRSRHVAPAAAR